MGGKLKLCHLLSEKRGSCALLLIHTARMNVALEVVRNFSAKLSKNRFSGHFPSRLTDGKPLKLTLDTEAIIEINEDGTEIRYRTNTLPGSSGSPCFNSNWELVALHHSGDPSFGNPQYNAATPFSAILNLLSERGLADQLGGSIDCI